MEKTLTCISCPLGCLVTADINEAGEITKVEGNMCKRGDSYVRKEITNPSRMVTSTVRVSNGAYPLVSVRTRTDIPRDKIFACMEEIMKISVKAPVKIGDVIIENVAGTGISVVATRNIPKK